MTGSEVWLGSGAIGVLVGALGRPWWYGPLAVIGIVIIRNVVDAFDPLYAGPSLLSGPEWLLIGMAFLSLPFLAGWVVGSLARLLFKRFFQPPEA